MDGAPDDEPTLTENPRHFCCNVVQDGGVCGDGRALGKPLIVRERLSQFGMPASA